MIKKSLDEEYSEHEVFSLLQKYKDFYSSLAYSTTTWISGTRSITNLDSYVFSSMEGTLESIATILSAGRINDSYALLRKYYDVTIINIYCNLYIENNSNSENLIVKKIDDWRSGAKSIPAFRGTWSYIKQSTKLEPVTELLQKGNTYDIIRDRCNDHLHYNFYHNVIYNDNNLFIPDRLPTLDTFSEDLSNLFIQHLAYLFYLKDNYMMASDYTDSLVMGLRPAKRSQYFVAPFIQNIFNCIMKDKRPDIAELIIDNTNMNLE